LASALIPIQGVNATSNVSGTTLNSCAKSSGNAKAHQDFDVVILGGTPSGVAAAVTASKFALKVALLSQSQVVGGAISNGVVATDIGNARAISGYSRYVLGLFKNKYWNDPDWRIEPKAAESIFASELQKAKITVRKNISLKSVGTSANQINTLNTSDGQHFCGRVFIDATYTGDLLAMAGLKFNLSDSDLSAYGEKQTSNPYIRLIAEMTDKNSSHTAKAFARNPYVRSFEKLPATKNIFKKGMPSMTYRLCVTKVTSNKVIFRKSPNYVKWAPSWKLFMKNYFNKSKPATMHVEPNGTILTKLWQIAKIPNGKYDLNSGRSSFTNVSVPKEYYSDPSKRNSINKEFATYLQDFLYFVQNDKTVPNAEKQALTGFGLCKDEFVDNHNFPYQPYIRAGQRLDGQKKLTSTDIITNREKGDSVVIGSYRLDMKPGLMIYSQNKLYQDWSAFLKAPVYEIPFGTMIPKKGIRNLITSVSISASPLAYSSLRMEVQFMALGQVAGIASSIAINENKSFSEGMYRDVQIGLRKAGAAYKIKEICKLMTNKEKIKQYFDPLTCEPHPVIH
jgi:hypothetical protein